MGADLSSRTRSPLTDFSVQSGGELTILELPFLTQLNVRAKGVDLPGVNATQPLTFPPGHLPVLEPGGHLLGLGPDEWLAVAPPGAAGQLEAALRSSAPGDSLSIVDVSAQRTTILLSGPQVRDLLAHGCALDLTPGTFAVGRCAETMLARAQVIIWRTGPDEFRVLVRASFARYLLAWLLDAAAELLVGATASPL